ncbi:hypothetical protein T310_1826 [Rasamsonia emersonii CBS 393.64]|uniref:Uncharacterized protein n=1 Tax=Rasamsonia emersonii (strain ATCC 16479 / CBS 393.64 / IMI 116815) TaxID=1408163 RepID=A0A0F4Z107_RASE3|nr:hypothetical protein T310_1826 [Rasamsonia emersonii CBS 393.64]KKA24174.1 hypothetical protein T310_1826 [Rasamsonia emersonii CBS 393.64]
MMMMLNLAIAAPVGDNMKNDNDNDKRQVSQINHLSIKLCTLGTLDYLAGTQGNPAVGALGNLAPQGNIMNSVHKIPVIETLGNFGTEGGKKSSASN